MLSSRRLLTVEAVLTLALVLLVLTSAFGLDVRLYWVGGFIALVALTMIILNTLDRCRRL